MVFLSFKKILQKFLAVRKRRPEAEQSRKQMHVSQNE
jgi:predicted methyltransferase